MQQLPAVNRGIGFSDKQATSVMPLSHSWDCIVICKAAGLLLVLRQLVLAVFFQPQSVDIDVGYKPYRNYVPTANASSDFEWPATILDKYYSTRLSK